MRKYISIGEQSGMVWGRCSDNLKFGMKFTERLLNKLDPGNDANAAMRWHNYKVGLRVSETISIVN